MQYRRYMCLLCGFIYDETKAGRKMALRRERGG